MSTINASNYGDGTDSVPASAVLEGTAKAWASIGGTSTPASIDNSYNTSSVTDGGTGGYTSNFTSSMNTALFACQCSSSLTGQVSRINNRTTSSFQTQSVDVSGTAQDAASCAHTVHGDLA